MSEVRQGQQGHTICRMSDIHTLACKLEPHLSLINRQMLIGESADEIVNTVMFTQ